MAISPAIRTFPLAATFPLVEVRGGPYEMGRQHGEQAAALVHRYLDWIERIARKPRGELVSNALRFESFIGALSQKYLDEVRGLAEGAKITYPEALLCQARAEAARSWEGGCTAFALTGAATADGNTFIGQNQDLEPGYADVAILLRVRPNDSRPSALMFTFAGQLGYSGLNDRGVAHFANALYGFPWRPALPHYPLKRAVLEQSDLKGAIDLIRRNRVCSAGNMVLADGSGAIADVEITPDHVSIYDDDHSDKRIHSNHCIAPELEGRDSPAIADTFPRLARMRRLVKEQWGAITVDALKQMLADHEGDPGGICRHGEAGMHSVSGYIAEPVHGVLHVRRGHGCNGAWTAYQV